MMCPSLQFFFLLSSATILQSVGKATSSLVFIIFLLMSVLHVQNYCLYATKNVIFPKLCFF